jgi:NAD(P)H dehydrogenase (quinone)
VGDEPSVAGVLQAHIKTVAYLKTTGLDWTVVREGTYAHLWNNMAGFLKTDGPKGEEQECVIPGDGPNAWVNREELGIATGRIVGNWVSQINLLYTEKIERDFVKLTNNSETTSTKP